MHRVLLVEDDIDTREAIALVLELEGFEVSSAGDGLEALAQMRHGAIPCVVVADRRMPELGGMELAHAIAADPELAGVACLVASGDPAPGADEMRELRGWVQKPFEADTLIGLLHRVCDHTNCRCSS